jgi:hypothetical protein
VNGHGGRRDGAGRKPGALNKVSADIRALAEPYGAPAVAELAKLAGLTATPGAANDATRVAALRELLDRAYGRPAQYISNTSDHSITALHLVAARAVSRELMEERGLTPPSLADPQPPVIDYATLSPAVE